MSSPVQGALSDRFGRRPVILISNLGLAVDFAMMALAPSLWVLFVGRAVSGLTAASFSTANAYIADVTAPDKRAAAFGMLGAAFGLGFVIGPALGGLLGGIDLRLPFWVTAGLALVNFSYGYFVLPESLPRERRTPRFDLQDRAPDRRPEIPRPPPAGAGPGAAGVPQPAGALRAAEHLRAVHRLPLRLGPDPGRLRAGRWSASAAAIVQAWLTGKLAPRLGDRRMLLFGLAFGALSLLMMGLAAAPWLLVAAIPVMALWGLAEPATQSMLTQQIAPDEQGRLQGALSSLMAFAGIFGPTLFTQIFAWSIHSPQYKLPGAAFLVAAALLVGCVVWAWRLTRGLRRVVPAPAAAETEP